MASGVPRDPARLFPMPRAQAPVDAPDEQAAA
jgi:hypothetical protein